MTETEAKQAQAISAIKNVFMGASIGFVAACGQLGASKVLFTRNTEKIFGAQICGWNGGELIYKAALALKMGESAKDISLTIHAYPALAETFAFACERVDGSITDGLQLKEK